ncbi:hypothetical protein [Blastococcus sp. TF02-8]|uniref:hypothetical protein n=1 Tax=Blastococcus sp. TF02-8 TaxID=2250574 RepID=UPI0011BE2F3E|nr:hypothetical protein [Blastococcus sp. TF02-8]
MATALAVVIVASYAWISRTREERSANESGPPATLLTAPPSRTYTSVPQADVDEVHRALHGLGDACAPEASSRSADAIDGHLDVLLEFVRRHPAGGFRIDDEDATSLSLLLVLQEELRACAPSQIPRVEALLPPRFRASDSPSS